MKSSPRWLFFFNDMTSPILNYTYLRKKSQITNFRKHIHTQDVTSIMVPGFYSVCQLLFLDKQIEVNHNFYNSSDSITIYRSLKCVENRKKVMYFRNKITKKLKSTKNVTSNLWHTWAKYSPRTFSIAADIF